MTRAQRIDLKVLGTVVGGCGGKGRHGRGKRDRGGDGSGIDGNAIAQQVVSLLFGALGNKGGAAEQQQPGAQAMSQPGAGEA
jgi:hypothetical protein